MTRDPCDDVIETADALLAERDEAARQLVQATAMALDLTAERDRLRKLLERVYREGVWAQGDEGTGPAIRTALSQPEGSTDA